MAGRQCIAFGVRPFVHVESMNVIAFHAPLLQKINRPTIHPHRAHRENHRKLTPFITGHSNRVCNLVAHLHVKIFDGFTFHQLKIFVPPGPSFVNGVGRVRAAGVDLGKIPSCWKKAFHHRAVQGGQQIHVPATPKSLNCNIAIVIG